MSVAADVLVIDDDDDSDDDDLSCVVSDERESNRDENWMICANSMTSTADGRRKEHVLLVLLAINNPKIGASVYMCVCVCYYSSCKPCFYTSSV